MIRHHQTFGYLRAQTPNIDQSPGLYLIDFRILMSTKYTKFVIKAEPTLLLT